MNIEHHYVQGFDHWVQSWINISYPRPIPTKLLRTTLSTSIRWNSIPTRMIRHCLNTAGKQQFRLSLFQDYSLPQVEGYSPLGKGLVLGDPTVRAISAQLGVTPAQVLVRWSMQQGVVTIPKSVKKERVEENWAAWSFNLEESQMEALGSLHMGTRVTWDPDQVP